MSDLYSRDLEYRRVDHLIRQNVQAPALTVLYICIFLSFAWEHISHAVLVTWAALWVSTVVVRGYFTYRWFKLKDYHATYTIAELQRWSWIVKGGTYASGIALGVMSFLSTIYLGPTASLAIAMLMFGMCSSSIATYALSLPSTLGFLFLTIGAWMAAEAVVENWILCSMLLIYMLVHIRLAKNWNKYAMDFLRINYTLHQHKEKLQLAMDSSGAASWAWDPRIDSFTCDENFRHVLRCPVDAIRRLDDYLHLVHPEDRIKVRNLFLEVKRSGAIDSEHRLNGSAQTIALRGKVQESDKGTVVSGITWDITDKKNEEKVRFERDLLEKANHVKLMFLANVSHEMRTPLTAINGFTEDILNDASLPAHVREKLSVVLRNGRYLTSVVHDLLDLSKAEAEDGIFIQKSKVVLPQEINDAIHVVMSLAEQKQLKLNVNYESPVPEAIISDATRLRQILINLLSNSVKYTERGQVDINVSYEGDQTRGQLRIVVVDTGMGITKDDQSKLFQPFTRGESVQIRKRHGSGLGLALSRTLAVRLGGDLRLLSSVPQNQFSQGGTAFELRVEVKVCEGSPFLEKHIESKNLPTPPSEKENVSFDNRRFLVVEDDEDIRSLLKEHLEKFGANVVTCEHGGEAVDKALDSHFDAVVMDIKMPVMDGYQATNYLRQHGFRYPIIALTAHANPSDMIKCYQAGCDYYLSKPVDFSHLKDVLKRCVNLGILATS